MFRERVSDLAASTCSNSALSFVSSSLVLPKADASDFSLSCSFCNAVFSAVSFSCFCFRSVSSLVRLSASSTFLRNLLSATRHPLSTSATIAVVARQKILFSIMRLLQGIVVQLNQLPTGSCSLRMKPFHSIPRHFFCNPDLGRLTLINRLNTHTRG